MPTTNQFNRQINRISGFSAGKASPARTALVALAASLLAASPALAHTGEGVTGGFLSGLMHPIFGWDHVVAMVAVGLWGAVLGSPAIWILPITFPLVMALGAALGIAGVTVPFIEAGIALSGVVLGLLVLFLVRAPVAVAGVIVAFFAIFHGYAHGTELPDAANPFAYAVGFVIATGLLHAVGIAFGALNGQSWGKMAIRAGGAVIALVGGAFLAGLA
ncbi:HupE/UreJ family protein [Hoeflea sp.]|uniref:HupE/UreJ family protein n=1 Tax=Hoeflea sp. TaxID=1940281 RepID=UPI003B522810